MAAEEAEKFLADFFGPGEGPELGTPPSSTSSTQEVEAVEPSLVPEPLRAKGSAYVTKQHRPEFWAYHMATHFEKAKAIMATVERLESPTPSSSVPLRTLASEMRKKPSQRTLVPPIVEETPIDPKLLDVLLKKLVEQDYLISAPYATKFLHKHDLKLVPALAAIKYDIDAREAFLHSSGRVSFTQSAQEQAGTPNLQTRDQMISFLETEDKQYREIAEKGWESTIGHSLRVNGRYRGERELNEAMAFYVQENKFRNARAEHYKSAEVQQLNPGEREVCMQEWERHQRESEASISESEDPVEQAALAARCKAFAHRMHVSRYQATVRDKEKKADVKMASAHQATVADEDETTETTSIGKDKSTDTTPAAKGDSKVAIDDVVEKVENIAEKLKHMEIRVQTDPIALSSTATPPTPTPPTTTHPTPNRSTTTRPTAPPVPAWNPFDKPWSGYNPYERLATAVENFRINAQIAEQEAAKSSPTPPKSKEYEPDHMNKYNFPKTLVNALESGEFYSEDNLIDCLFSLATDKMAENSELRKQNIKTRHEEIDLEAQREEEAVTKRYLDILKEKPCTPPHAGEKFEILLSVIPQLVAGPKPVTQIQMMTAKQEVTKNIRQIDQLLTEAVECEYDQINQLREHMNGKTVFTALSGSYSLDNVKWLAPVLTDKLQNELIALFHAAKKVDAEISATPQSAMEEAIRDNARANIKKPINEFQEQVGQILSMVHEDLMEIPFDQSKLEILRRELEEKRLTLSDSLQKAWNGAIRGTVYNQIENDSLEAVWALIVQVAKDIDKSLKEKPTKNLAKGEEVDSVLSNLLNQLRVPLMELLPRETDVIEFHKTINNPETMQEKITYKSAVLRLFQEYDNLSEELQTEISETADRDAFVEEQWNQPDVVQNLEEAALSNKGKGKADNEALVHVMGMHAYAARLLEAPLIKQLVSEELQEEVRHEIYSAFPQVPNSTNDAPEDVENQIEQTIEAANEEHVVDVQTAIQNSLQTEQTRKIKPASVSEGLRKKMAKAKIEKRLNEVVAGGAASGEIDLKEGVKVWNEEHGLFNVDKAEKQAIFDPLSPSLFELDHETMLKMAMKWYNTGKIPGHEDCKCPPGTHTDTEELLTQVAETVLQLGAVSQAKTAAQTSLAGLNTDTQLSAKPASTVGQKSKGKAKKTASNKTQSTAQASSSASQDTGIIAPSQYPANYDATPSGFKDALSEANGELLDMETLGLHDRLLKLNLDVAAGSWEIKEHGIAPQRYVVRTTGMKLDWANTALNICGASAALAVEFVKAARNEIENYLIKKGQPTTQLNIDMEGFRFGLRCQDHFMNQLEISLGKKPKYPFGFGFNTTEACDGQIVPAACAPLVTGVNPGAPSSSTAAVAAGSSSKVPRASSSSNTSSTVAGPSGTKSSASSSSTTAGPSSDSSSALPSSMDPAASSNVAHLATIIQTAARSAIDRGLAVQMATMIEDSVSTAVMRAANIPDLTPEIVSAIIANANIASPPNFNTIADPSSSPMNTTQTDTTGASSSVSLETGSETTPSGSSGGGKKKKQRPAAKKAGRRR